MFLKTKVVLNHHAFTLVEIVISVVILAIAVAGVLSAYISGTRLISSAKYRLQAINYAQQVLENLRQELRASTWDTGGLSIGSHGPFNITAPHPLANFSATYSYNVIGDSNGDGTVNPDEPKRVDTTVSWTMP